MKRRTFLRNFITIGITGGCLGGWRAIALGAVTPGIGIVKVRVSDYPSLSAIGGSIRLNAGPLAPIMINRASATAFHAMSIVCQHQGCWVDAYDAQAGNISCPCHGSEYAIDGSLISGPAMRGLETYETSHDGTGMVTIRVPGLGFDITGVTVQSRTGPATRFAITFPVAAFSEYVIYRRANLTDTPQQVAFATTPTGSASTTKTRPTFTGDLTVYVDATGTRGFFSAALLMTEFF